MVLNKETYYLIKDKGVMQDRVFDTPKDVITHLNDLVKAHTGMDIRVKNGEVEVLAVEVVGSTHPTVDIVIALPYEAFV